MNVNDQPIRDNNNFRLLVGENTSARPMGLRTTLFTSSRAQEFDAAARLIANTSPLSTVRFP